MVNLTIAKIENLLNDRTKFTEGTGLMVNYDKQPNKKFKVSFALSVYGKPVLEHEYEVEMTKRDANEQIVEDIIVSLFSLGAWAMFSSQFPNDANELTQKAEKARAKIDEAFVKEVNEKEEVADAKVPN